jgi:hypothetical protein
MQSPYAVGAMPDSYVTSVYVSGQMDSGFVNKHNFGEETLLKVAIWNTKSVV